MELTAALVGLITGILVTAMVLARVDRETTDQPDAYKAGYQAALDEIKERHKARGRKAAATRKAKG
jgi:hypothetical protein